MPLATHWGRCARAEATPSCAIHGPASALQPREVAAAMREGDRAGGGKRQITSWGLSWTMPSSGSWSSRRCEPALRRWCRSSSAQALISSTRGRKPSRWRWAVSRRTGWAALASANALCVDGAVPVAVNRVRPHRRG